MVTSHVQVVAEHLCLSHFSDLRRFGILIPLFFFVPRPLSAPASTTTPAQPSTHSHHPPYTSLPQDVAVIVVPNKVYGITDL